MNAGAHGGETKDVLSRRAASIAPERSGRLLGARDGLFLSPFVGAGGRDLHASRVSGPAGRYGRNPSARWSGSLRRARPRSRSARKPAARPSRTRPGEKAWELIDKAGCRGLAVGDAQVSTMHCNFLINRGAATAARPRGAWRGSAPARARDEWGRAGMGDQAHRRQRRLRTARRRRSDSSLSACSDAVFRRPFAAITPRRLTRR